MNICLLALLSLAALALASPMAGTVTEIDSFEIERSPSGMFYDADSDILYILCGTATNNDHYLYAYTTAGDQECLITIPQSVGMSRVDGFQIVDSQAYIVDSQGPLYAGDMIGMGVTALGGSIYAVTWDNPCDCASGACALSSVEWMPTIESQIFINATDTSIQDGNMIDNDFRNSGIVVKDDSAFAVNGVHPVINGDLTSYYPKSLIKVSLTEEYGAATEKWSFDSETIGRQVDMEALTCAADDCDTYIYIGDEYNFIDRLTLSESDPSVAVEVEWDLNSIVGNIPADKGIESMTYASSTGYFYVGIQETATVYVVELSTDAATSSSEGSMSASMASSSMESSSMQSSAASSSSSVVASSSDSTVEVSASSSDEGVTSASNVLQPLIALVLAALL